MIFIRSLVFNILFYIWTILVIVGGLPSFILGRLWIRKAAFIWGVGTNALLHIAQIRVRISGLEHRPQTPFIMAVKHQSLWETTQIERLAPECALISKRELLWIPLFGQLLWKADIIAINRARGQKVLPQLLAGARHFYELGRSILIFPEGTRTQAGTRKRYKYGIYALYKELNVPVVPVAHNAGYFWARRKFLKYPGEIVMEVLPPIPAGLDEKTFMQTLENTIEDACAKMVPKAPLHKKRFSPLALIAGIVLSVLVGTSILWLKAAAYVEDALTHWIAQAHASGRCDVTYDALKITGFPLAIDIALKNPSIADKKRGGMSGAVDGTLTFEAAPWHPHTIKIQSQGTLSLVGPMDKMHATVGEISGFLEIDGTTLTRAEDLEFRDFSGALRDERVQVSEGVIGYDGTDSDPYLHLACAKIDLSQTSLHPVEPVIDTLEIKARRTGAGAPLASFVALNQWSQGGGTVEIDALEMTSKTLSMKGQGTLTLDEKLQPVAAFSVVFEGLERVVDQLVAQQILNKTHGSVAKFSLSLFARKAEDAAPSHKISLTLQSGELSLGPVPLMRVPTLDWKAFFATA